MPRIFNWDNLEGFSLKYIIAYMESTDESTWRTDTVRGKDGTNCFFGHLFDMGGGDTDKGGSYLWDYFEEVYATTFMLYPVNDGKHPKYPQPTAKQRVIAYLKDLDTGEEKTTLQLWKEYDESRILTPSPRSNPIPTGCTAQ